MEGTAVLELNASEHPIKAVTVFSSKKAEIVRSFSVELEVRRFYILLTIWVMKFVS